MTGAQSSILTIVAVAVVFFAWGRWRADLVAAAALCAAVMLQVIAPDAAFSGFADPGLVVIAAMLALSATLRDSGLFGAPTRLIERLPQRLALRGLATGLGVVAASAVMSNNEATAALAPAAEATARQTGRPASALVLALSLLSILGGTVTLVGTIPNILVSSIRKEALGAGFGILSFAPVGLAVAAAGLVALAWFWRSVDRMPASSVEAGAGQRGLRFTSELVIPTDSALVGLTVREIEDGLKARVVIEAIIREDLRRLPSRPGLRIAADDILVVSGDPEALQRVVERFGLSVAGPDAQADQAAERVGIVEAVVTPVSSLIGQSQASSGLDARLGLGLLAVGRHGDQRTIRLRRLKLRAGDVLIIRGPLGNMSSAMAELGCFILGERRLRVGRRRQVFGPVLILGAALLLAGTGILPLSIALLAGLVLLVGLNLAGLSELYQTIGWPTLVEIGALLPFGIALRSTGLVDLCLRTMIPAGGLPRGSTAVVAVLAVSLGSTAVVRAIPALVLLCPFALGLAEKMSVSPDPLLMAVALGCACDVLAPVRRDAGSGAELRSWRSYPMLALTTAVLVWLVGSAAILLVWRMTP